MKFISINKDGDMYFYIEENVKKSHTSPYKVASFDLDGTLIKTKSGKTFPVDSDDWEWKFPNVPEKIKDLYEQNYIIVIFTNQKGIGSGKNTIQEFEKKIENMITELGVGLHIFISTKDDYYRKPLTGMWDYFSNNGNIDVEKSFYCGDAGGRSLKFGEVKDFSSSDKDFAHNIGIKFLLPEEFFLEKEIKYQTETVYTPTFFSENFPIVSENEVLEKYDFIKSDKEHPTMIIMVGPPASGKSTLAKLIAKKKDLIRINQDALGTKAKCFKETKDAIIQGKSIIIDNTNPSPEIRKEYLDLIDKFASKDRPYTLYAIDMKIPRIVSSHLNYFRIQQSKGENKKIPSVAYNVYYKKYVEPNSVKEGLTDVIRHKFQLFHNPSPKLFYHYPID